MLYIFAGLALGVHLLGWLLSCTPRRTKQPQAQPPRYCCAVCHGPIDAQDSYYGSCGRLIVKERAQARAWISTRVDH